MAINGSVDVDSSAVRSVLDALIDPVLYLSSIRDDAGVILDFRYEFVNARALSNLGLTEPEMLGHRLLELFPSHVELGLFDRFCEVVETGEPALIEVPQFEEGNLAGAWEVSAARLGDGIVGITRDVTARVLAAKDLADRERHYRIVADNAAEIALVVRDLTLEWVSPTVVATLGWTPDEVIGQRPEDFIHPDDMPSYRFHEQRVVTERRSKTRIRFRHKNGEYRWCDIFARVPHEAEFEPHGVFVGVLCDVHAEVIALSAAERAEAEARELEGRIRQSERVESLGLLASGIAHDFNNVLSIVLGNAELARGHVADPELVGSSLDTIAAAAQQAADLTRQLLDYAGNRQSLPGPVDVNAVVDDTLLMLGVAVAKPAALDINLEPGIRPVTGDASQIRQVLMNLVINAADALNGESGRVTISTSTRQYDAAPSGPIFGGVLDGNEPGAYVVLEITDTGCGMSTDTVARLFDPFFTTKVRGRGLGMSVVHGLVRSLGGFIEVDSVLGRGTKVRVGFRIANAPGPAPAANAGP